MIQISHLKYVLGATDSLQCYTSEYKLEDFNNNNNIIEAKILIGAVSGQIVHIIPRVLVIKNVYPLEFKRVQFPIKYSLAISINKAQGQTMNVAGIDNTQILALLMDNSRVPVQLAQENNYTSMPQNKKYQQYCL